MRCGHCLRVTDRLYHIAVGPVAPAWLLYPENQHIGYEGNPLYGTYVVTRCTDCYILVLRRYLAWAGLIRY